VISRAARFGVLKILMKGMSKGTRSGILKELYEGHIKVRRESTVADIERGKANGEFAADIDPELLIDSMFGPVYYRMLLRLGPLTEQFGNDLISQAICGARPSSAK
jgi:Tetracyclin repressor-like, C-terminal domain